MSVGARRNRAGHAPVGVPLPEWDACEHGFLNCKVCDDELKELEAADKCNKHNTQEASRQPLFPTVHFVSEGSRFTAKVVTLGAASGLAGFWCVTRRPDTGNCYIGSAAEAGRPPTFSDLHFWARGYLRAHDEAEKRRLE